MGHTARVTGGLLIGGQIVGTNGDIRAVDPASGQEIEPAFVVARETDVDQACRLATEAFDIYRATGLEERAAFLEKIADNILELGDTLIERAHFETVSPCRASRRNAHALSFNCGCLQRLCAPANGRMCVSSLP